MVIESKHFPDIILTVLALVHRQHGIFIINIIMIIIKGILAHLFSSPISMLKEYWHKSF